VTASGREKGRSDHHYLFVFSMLSMTGTHLPTTADKRRPSAPEWSPVCGPAVREPWKIGTAEGLWPPERRFRASPAVFRDTIADGVTVKPGPTLAGLAGGRPGGLQRGTGHPPAALISFGPRKCRWQAFVLM